MKTFRTVVFWLHLAAGVGAGVVILVMSATGAVLAFNLNWHNVVGFWCAAVLIVLTATGVVMSYPWANRLLYQLAGSPLPAARDAGGRGGQQTAAPVPAIGDLDRLWTRAEQQLPTWQTVTMRLPDRAGAPVSFTMNDAQHWILSRVRS